jgi:ribosomal protein L11 methyltransferase
MSLFEFRIEMAAGDVPAIEDLLAEHEERDLMVVEDKVAGRAWLVAYGESPAAAQKPWEALQSALAAHVPIGSATVNALPDKDWKESYKEHFKAWQFGRLHWVPVWERETYRIPSGDGVLWLDPGMAFGTGNHETTRLVVERLVSFANERGTAGRVIDAGCGSGILALSAARLGFADIVAFDNDALSIDVSRENAAANGLVGVVQWEVGDLVSGLAGRQADLLMANIQADVLTKFSTVLWQAVAPRGTLVLSGILASELESVRAAFQAQAPTATVATRVLGEWSDLVLTAPSL